MNKERYIAPAVIATQEVIETYIALSAKMGNGETIHQADLKDHPDIAYTTPEDPFYDAWGDARTNCTFED